jgi:hypothetical protein
MEGIIENAEASRYLHLLAEHVEGAQSDVQLNETDGTLTLTVTALDPLLLPYLGLGQRVTFDLSGAPGEPVRWWIEKLECRGHPSSLNGPGCATEYCDGSCRK